MNTGVVLMWMLLYNPVSHDLETVQLKVPDQEICENTLKLIEFEGLGDDEKGEFTLVAGGCM